MCALSYSSSLIIPSPSSRLETEEVALTLAQLTLKCGEGRGGLLRALELVQVPSSWCVVGIQEVGKGTLSWGIVIDGILLGTSMTGVDIAWGVLGVSR